MKRLYALVIAFFAIIVAQAATVYFQNTGNWAKVYMYTWTGSSDNGWPGKQLTETVEKNGVTYFKGESNFQSIIFNNGSGTQTKDLGVVDNAIYNASGMTGESFEGGEVEIKHELYLVGANFGNWGVVEQYKMSTTDEVNFTISVPTLKGDFKLVDAGVWIGSSVASVALNTPKTLTPGDGDNLKLDDQNATDITVNYNVETAVLLVTGTGSGETPIEPEPDYSSWYINIFGTFNNWQDNGLQPVDGISTHKNLAIGTKEFKVKIWNGSDVYYSTGGEVATGEWVVVEGNATANMTVAGATDDSVYDVEWDCANHAIRITLVSGGETPIEPIPDFSGWYVNVLGDFNAWGDNGKQPNAEGIATQPELAIGTSGFKVKLWTGEEVWYSTGGEVALDEWVVIEGNAEANMTVAGAAEGNVYKVEWDCVKHAIRITFVRGGDVKPDYTGWYLNVVGDFNSWNANGVQFDEEGMATASNMAIGTSQFKIKIWNGSSDVWYANGAAVATGEWVKMPGNGGNMTVDGATADSVYDVEWNAETSSLRLTLVSGGTTGIENVEAEAAEAEYFNLQGVRVANPGSGIYIRRQGSQVSKVVL